jgi:hypothetical protein
MHVRGHINPQFKSGHVRIRQKVEEERGQARGGLVAQLRWDKQRTNESRRVVKGKDVERRRMGEELPWS